MLSDVNSYGWEGSETMYYQMETVWKDSDTITMCVSGPNFFNTCSFSTTSSFSTYTYDVKRGFLQLV